jgi:serine/threonine protein kinase
VGAAAPEQRLHGLGALDVGASTEGHVLTTSQPTSHARPPRAAMKTAPLPPLPPASHLAPPRGSATPASDLYSLGATLLYLVSGQPPFAFPQERMRINYRDRVTTGPVLGGECHARGEGLRAEADRRAGGVKGKSAMPAADTGGRCWTHLAHTPAPSQPHPHPDPAPHHQSCSTACWSRSRRTASRRRRRSTSRAARPPSAASAPRPRRASRRARRPRPPPCARCACPTAVWCGSWAPATRRGHCCAT